MKGPHYNIVNAPILFEYLPVSLGDGRMNPSIFNEGPYRSFFFSREEERIDVHVASAEVEAKFWLVPVKALASSTGLNKNQILKLQKIVVNHEKEIRSAWQKHFKT